MRKIPSFVLLAIALFSSACSQSNRTEPHADLTTQALSDGCTVFNHDAFDGTYEYAVVNDGYVSFFGDSGRQDVIVEDAVSESYYLFDAGETITIEASSLSGSTTSGDPIDFYSGLGMFGNGTVDGEPIVYEVPATQTHQYVPIWIHHGEGDVQWSVSCTDGTDPAPDPGNAAPEIDGFAVSPETALVGQEVVATATFEDPDGDLLAAEIDWGDTTRSALASGSSAVHAYTSAGSYSVTLEVSDGVANATDTAAVAVITPQTALANLVEDIEAASLRGGLEQSLVQKLENASRNVDDGLIAEALEKLRSFVDQVEAQRGKSIEDATADVLVSHAQTIIDVLSDS